MLTSDGWSTSHAPPAAGHSWAVRNVGLSMIVAQIVGNAGVPHFLASMAERSRKLGGFLADRTGITLIESLMACLVVGIAAVGLATMFARGQASISGEGDNRVAVYL